MNLRRHFFVKPDVTDNVADNIFRVDIPTGKHAAMNFKILFTATDGTDFQHSWQEGGKLDYLNKTGTPAGGSTNPTETSNRVSAGTITVASWTFTAAAGKVTIGVTVNSSLVSPTIKANVTYDQETPMNVVPE
jgi:hypothetical protein